MAKKQNVPPRVAIIILGLLAILRGVTFLLDGPTVGYVDASTAQTGTAFCISEWDRWSGKEHMVATPTVAAFATQQNINQACQVPPSTARSTCSGHGR
jgi:hypothetical protein